MRGLESPELCLSRLLLRSKAPGRCLSSSGAPRRFRKPLGLVLLSFMAFLPFKTLDLLPGSTASTVVLGLLALLPWSFLFA